MFCDISVTQNVLPRSIGEDEKLQVHRQQRCIVPHPDIQEQVAKAAAANHPQKETEPARKLDTANKAEQGREKDTRPYKESQN